MGRLIVNADDYGISHERDQGIEHGFSHGCVSSVTLLLAGDSASFFPYKQVSATLSLGLHLNLTEGAPMAGAQRVPSLVGADGKMLGKHGFRARLAAGDVNLAEVEVEVEAQLRRFEALVGRKPSHVDSHQHVHVLPALVRVIATVLVRPEFSITKMRCPQESFEAAPWFSLSPSREFYETVSAQGSSCKAQYESHGILFPDVSSVA